MNVGEAVKQMIKNTGKDSNMSKKIVLEEDNLGNLQSRCRSKGCSDWLADPCDTDGGRRDGRSSPLAAFRIPSPS